MKSKILSLLLSVCIALGMWLYVITVESPGSTETKYNIPVVFEGETLLRERGLIITSDTNLDVDLTLSGNRSDLKLVDASNTVVKVDLTKIYDPGKHELDYRASYPGTVANNAFTEENRYPSRITVTVENLSTREIPVVVTYSGELPEGYIADKSNAVLSATAISVSGPQSVVDRITRAEILVDLTDCTESISQSYRFTLQDSENLPVDAGMITVNTEEIHLDLKIQMIKFVDLVVTIVSGGGATEKNIKYEIKPNRIQVSGSEAALESLGDEINLGTINLADYTEDTVLTLPFTLPDTVTNHSNITEATVDLKFVDLSIKEITVEKIQLVNIPEGMEAELITEQVTVSVRGPSADIAKLTTEAITVTVDMKEAVAGTSTYKVTVNIDPKFTTLGPVGAGSVTVTVQAAEE